MNDIIIPSTYNYIGVFLTFRCSLHCSYCINNYRSKVKEYTELSAKDWIRGLNRIKTSTDLPITLQGGEPFAHKGIYEIINGIDKHINIDILTNIQFPLDKFIANVDPKRLRRDAKYASIRVSFHIENMDLDDTIKRVTKLLKKGYSIGIWGVAYPKYGKLVEVAKSIALHNGIDFRIKEYLGYYEDRLRGTYKYPHALNGFPKRCMCKPSEMLIAPDGGIHRCHYELYTKAKPYTTILAKNAIIANTYSNCNTMGLCNPCDIKLKTNRYQIDGHCSVEIKEETRESSK